MAQTTFLTLSFLLAAALILAPKYTEADCNVCNNGIACIDQTSYNICFGGKPDTTNVYTCPSGKVCTNTKLGCVDALSTGPSCDPNKGCDVCDGSSLFACTSRTTFAQCNGKTVTNIRGTCPKGLKCTTAKQSEICVPECKDNGIYDCNREKPL